MCAPTSRSKIIYALALLLFLACWAARSGNEADARARSRCAAIGYEMRVETAAKSADVERWRPANPHVAAQWDDYLKSVNRVADSLVDTFAGPQPTRRADRAWAGQQGLQGLTRAAKTCTGQKS